LLQQRYCKNGESPEGVFKRVANFLSKGDFKFEDNLQTLMTNGVFLPNSPCLFNAGMPNGMLHACFILPIEDDIHSIFTTISNMAYIFKGGGGVGINFSNLREKNAFLSGGGSSSGVLSFMEIFDHVVDTVKQGGMRRGALMGILDYTHPEIYNFIKVKLEGKLQNFNLSIMVTDEFMNAVLEDKDIDVVSPKNGIVSKVGAKDIFDVACFASWVNGDPAFLFYDRINEDNPFFPEVKINTVNPCQPADSLLLDGEYLRRIDSEKPETWKSWYTGIKEVIRLELNNGMHVDFTPEHKLMLADGTWCEAKNSIGKELKWGLGNRKSLHINEKDIVQGFLFGDGFRCGCNEGVSVKLTKRKEWEIYELLSSFGFEEEDCGVLYINRKKLMDTEFLNYKTFDRQLPKYILESHSDRTAGFLRGLFEANGSVNKQNQISLKGTNKEMIKDVQLILASFGIPSWISINKPTKVEWDNGDYISKESYNLQIAPRNAWLFKEKIGFYSSMKNDKIIKLEGEYYTKLKIVGYIPVGEMEVWDYSMYELPHHNFCQGVIASNCSEVAMPHYSACCLGSINVSKFVWKNSFNFDRFGEVVQTGMRALTSINELSEYPLPEIKEAMQKYNPVGLGIFGFADCLIKLGIRYDSQDCLDFIDKLGTVYRDSSLAYNPDTFYFYRRIIAPTGSLSILADCSSGIEPVYDVAFERSLTIGKIEEVRDLYKSEFVRTAHEVSPEWHIKVLAKWQEYLDGGCSKTINMPNDASVEDIKNAYLTAWKMGVKGITVYRDGSRDQQVLYSKPSQPPKMGKCSDETCTL